MMARTRLLLRALVGEREKHVDIGVGKQILAPVTAQCQQGSVGWRHVCKGPAPHFNVDTIDDSRAAADGCGAVASTLTGLADKSHLP